MRYFGLLLLSVFIFSCKTDTTTKNNIPHIVCTTTMITDMAKIIAGDKAKVEGLMGSGVDPHLYKASEGDMRKLHKADLILYNGLHLEGKLVDIFEKMNHQKIKAIALAEIIDAKKLIGSQNFASNYDPHVWLHVGYWQQMTDKTAHVLAHLDPDHSDYYHNNAEAYISELEDLNAELEAKINTLPKDQRILVTAHDAFNYFGEQYDFTVVGLQGLSTATEAGVKDVQELTDYIISNRVKAIFIESSIPIRTVEALQAAVKAKGHEVAIGGELYSDALGTIGTPEGTYIGMYQHNVSTIVNALK